MTLLPQTQAPASDPFTVAAALYRATLATRRRSQFRVVGGNTMTAHRQQTFASRFRQPTGATFRSALTLEEEHETAVGELHTSAIRRLLAEIRAKSKG